MESPPLPTTPPPPLPPSRALVRGLAEALVVGPWTADALAAALTRATGRRGRWAPALAARILARFDEGPRPPAPRLAAFLAADGPLAALNARAPLRRVDWNAAPAMWPAPGAPGGWDVPPLVTPGDLAAFLGIGPSALDAYADLRGLARRRVDGPLCHYDYAWRPRPSGGARLIEAPRPRLKALQRRLLDGIAARIPPHDAAHGFRPGRSIVTFAAPHAGRAAVLGMDLRDFFPSVGLARVSAIFRTVGYPEPVARRLAGLCTGRMPPAVWRSRPVAADGPLARAARGRLLAPHLPQGAPTSPALANLAAHGLDARLSGLAAAAGVTYTRYADDLAFSGGGDFARSWRRFAVHVAATALEEGFEVNHHKTRVMRRSVRQRLAGVVVNDGPNAARDEVDRLRATLHNCLTRGPAAENRAGLPDFRAHLTGRVAHVAMINPARGARLRAILDRIDWST